MYNCNNWFSVQGVEEIVICESISNKFKYRDGVEDNTIGFESSFQNGGS